MSRWTETTKPFAGSNARSMSIPLIYTPSLFIPSFVRFAPTRASLIYCVESESMSLKCRIGRRIREREEFLRGAEAPQRLQGRGGLHRRRLGTLSRNRASLSGLRHSELGHSFARSADHH